MIKVYRLTYLSEISSIYAPSEFGISQAEKKILRFERYSLQAGAINRMT
jgi:hypothetical protein